MGNVSVSAPFKTLRPRTNVARQSNWMMRRMEMSRLFAGFANDSSKLGRNAREFGPVFILQNVRTHQGRSNAECHTTRFEKLGGSLKIHAASRNHAQMG